MRETSMLCLLVKYTILSDLLLLTKLDKLNHIYCNNI